MTDITPQIVREHGLSVEEYGRIKQLLNRDPNLVELGVFSVMWSEHCSYKSTRAHLRRLPTKAPWVLQGPGENAGVIDIGDGDVAVFKMESHNHPSFIEPYQGAATGVGGIMRDVFTMGARPIAMMNALRFGAPDHPKTRHLVSGVVSGIGGYGNCMGVPTVGGEVNFHRSYNGNILVNAMCVGIARGDKIFKSAAEGAGNPVVYIGSKTGRDGIHGATMASAEFNEDSEEKRPTVQVGDPFTEKLLLEACLELMATDAIIAIQDMGAAGLTSSSAEMGSKGGSGIELDLDCVPQREENMTAYDMMLSESQERMLAVLKPGREGEAERIFKKWELDFAVIGRTTDSGRLIVKHKGAVVADMPVHALSEEAPVYNRPFERRTPASGTPAYDRARPVMDSLARLMASPDIASRRWVWEQYDNTVMADTVQRPGGDAAVVRVHNTQKALAITTDVTPRYCKADPFEGAKQAVAEAWRNLSAVGATPLAVTDNLNFGNPEKPEIMGEIASAVDGIAEACRTLDFPVVVRQLLALQRDQRRSDLADARHRRGRAAQKCRSHGDDRVQARRRCHHPYRRDERPSRPVDLSARDRRQGSGRGTARRSRDGKEKRRFRPHADRDGSRGYGARSFRRRFAALHSPKWRCRRGSVRMIALPDTGDAIAFLYGEDQARYLVAVADAERIVADAKAAGVPAVLLGHTGGDKIAVEGAGEIAIAALACAHEGWFPSYMGGTELPPSN